MFLFNKILLFEQFVQIGYTRADEYSRFVYMFEREQLFGKSVVTFHKL